MKPRRLGDILLELGAIDPLQLHSALAHQKNWGSPLGKVVVEKGFCSEAVVHRALAIQAGLPQVDLDAQPLDSRLAVLLPMKVAEAHLVVPLRLEGARQEVLVLAVAAPAPLTAIDAVRAITRKVRLSVYLATDSAIRRAIARLYLPAPRASTPAAAEEVPLVVGELLPEEARPILLFGWTEDAARSLASILRGRGFKSRVAGSAEVQTLDPEAVLISSVDAFEALYPQGRAPCRVVLVGRRPTADQAVARRVGARVLLEAPLSVEALLGALKYCRGPALPQA